MLSSKCIAPKYIRNPTYGCPFGPTMDSHSETDKNCQFLKTDVDHRPKKSKNTETDSLISCLPLNLRKHLFLYISLSQGANSTWQLMFRVGRVCIHQQSAREGGVGHDDGGGCSLRNYFLLTGTIRAFLHPLIS